MLFGYSLSDTGNWTFTILPLVIGFILFLLGIVFVIVRSSRKKKIAVPLICSIAGVLIVGVTLLVLSLGVIKAPQDSTRSESASKLRAAVEAKDLTKVLTLIEDKKVTKEDKEDEWFVDFVTDKKVTDVDYQIAELLIENVIDVNHKDKNDQTPLLLLSFSIAFNYETDRETNPDYDLMECLVRQGADVNAANSAQKTSLMIVFEFVPLADYVHSSSNYQWRYRTAELLVENGADVNLQDKNGLTALMVACNWRDYYNYNEISALMPEVVKLLLDNGADTSLKNNQKMTAYDCAVKYHALPDDPYYVTDEDNAIQAENYQLVIDLLESAAAT